MSSSIHAVEQFRGGLNCSQAVLAEFAADYGLDTEAALKVATGFGGGMGRLGLTCGAVTGAIAVLGLAMAAPDPRAPQAKVSVYAAVCDFVKQFEAVNGATACSELLGCNIGTPEGYEEATRQGLLQTRCPKYVADAVEILEEML